MAFYHAVHLNAPPIIMIVLPLHLQRIENTGIRKIQYEKQILTHAKATSDK